MILTNKFVINSISFNNNHNDDKGRMVICFTLSVELPDQVSQQSLG